MNEYRANFEGYVSKLEQSEVRTLDELVLWNIEHAEVELPPGEISFSKSPDYVSLHRAL